MAPVLLVELLDELLEPAGPEPIELSPLPPDDGDQRPFAAADERHQRREVERAPDANEIRHALAQRQRLPDVVEPRAEDGVTTRALAAELLRKERAQTGGVSSKTLLLLVRQLGPVGRLGAHDLVDEGVHAARRVARGRRDARIEVEVEADRASVRGAERREIAQALPGHSRRHRLCLPFTQRRDFTRGRRPSFTPISMRYPSQCLLPG